MPEEKDTLPQESVTRRLAIHGKVQGVWYRASAQAEATRLGLRGWVRNRREGWVEALVVGPQPAIDGFIDWARQGPPKAEVARIEISAADEETLEGFEQRPTA
jgi:acylphosphatase